MLRAKLHFSPAKKSSTNKRLLRENTEKNIPREKRLRDTRDSSTAQEVKNINLDDLDIASLARKRAKTEVSITPKKTITRTEEKSSEGSRVQH